MNKKSIFLIMIFISILLSQNIVLAQTSIICEWWDVSCWLREALKPKPMTVYQGDGEKYCSSTDGEIVCDIPVYTGGANVVIAEFSVYQSIYGAYFSKLDDLAKDKNLKFCKVEWTLEETNGIVYDGIGYGTASISKNRPNEHDKLICSFGGEAPPSIDPIKIKKGVAHTTFGPTDYKPPECIPSWTCGEWSPCIDNKQTRTCNDGCNNTKTEEHDCEPIIDDIIDEVVCGNKIIENDETKDNCPEDVCCENNNVEGCSICEPIIIITPICSWNPLTWGNCFLNFLSWVGRGLGKFFVLFGIKL